MSLSRFELVISGSLLALSSGTGPAKAEAPPCANDQMAIAQNALPAAQQLLGQAIAAVDNPSGDDLDRLRTWFGLNSSDGAQKVRQTLVNARSFTAGVSFRCVNQSSASKKDTFAYVLPDKSFGVVLGRFFWDAPDTGFDSRPGVIVHEMTHFLLIGATHDAAYGLAAARALAKSSRSSAQKNADNYEYFSEATASGAKSLVASRLHPERRVWAR